MGNDSCPVYDLSEDAAKNLVGSTSFHDFSKILASVCTGITCLVIIVHLFNHARHLSCPREQAKIMRISMFVPFYTIICLLCIYLPPAAVYLRPWLEVAQAHCLATFFQLLCEYVSPTAQERNNFFATLEVKDKKASKKNKGKEIDGMKWLKQQWVGIFQYHVVATIVAIATCVTEALGVYCQFKILPEYARLWLFIITFISGDIGFFSVILVAQNLKPHMLHLKPVTKLVVMNIVAGLGFLQAIIFWILDSAKALNSTDKMTYADIHIVIPALLNCVEMVFISLLVVWTYPVKPYHIQSSAQNDPERARENRSEYQGGPLGLKGFLVMINPWDTVKGTFIAALLLLAMQFPQDSGNDRNRDEYGELETVRH